MRYRMLGDKLVPIHQWWAAQPKLARSHLPAPAIRADGMAPTVNHADGKLYDSRSAYDAALRAKGCHIVEAGESMEPPSAPPSLVDSEPVEQSIRTAMDQLEGRT